VLLVCAADAARGEEKMSHIFVKKEQVIEAKPAEVFDALADYASRRPRILPPNYLHYAVEKGGHGGGTVIRYLLQAGGRERPYEMHVEETLKGQMLTERDQASSLVTRWSVLPVDGGQKSRVSVETDWESAASGIGGFFERTFAPLGLRKIYRDILIALALMVQSPTENQELLEASEQRPMARAGIYAMLAGSISLLALALGLKYLKSRA
jgi:hypothetical protein